MGEGTKTVNMQEELAALERRIAALERGQSTPPYYPMPVSTPLGCVCPVGAETCCGNMCCPRRSFPGVTWGNTKPVT